MSAVVLAGVLVGLVLFWALLSYNRFVQQRQLVASSWANVDTELRRRYDLVPNLVETVKGYAGHERQALAEVMEARAGAVGSQGRPAEQAADENVLAGALRHLLAVSEAYPDLHASAQFLNLQRELVVTEDRIQAARRFYNGNVRDYNRRVQSVPSNLVARLGRFEPEDYFEVEAAARAVPVVA